MLSRLRSLFPRRSLAAALALGLLTVSTSAGAQQPLPTVVVGILGVSSSIWPALIAQEKGFFRDAGINVEMVTTGQSARSAQQVAAGVINIGSSSMVDAFRAIDGGGELKVFMNSQAVGTHSLIAAKGIKSFADLKGKRVMTGGQKDITNLWWQAAARHHGLDPVNDVQLLFSGSTSNRLAALMAGGIEASVISPPQSFKAVEDGYTDLGPVAPYMGEFPMMIWHVNTRWAQENEDLVVAFVKAHNRATQFLIDPRNRPESVVILAKASNSGVADADKTWELSMKVKAYVPDGNISPQTVQRVIDVLQANGDLRTPIKPASAFFDDRFLRAAK